MLVYVYTCQHATLLETRVTCHGSFEQTYGPNGSKTDTGELSYLAIPSGCCDSIKTNGLIWRFAHFHCSHS